MSYSNEDLKNMLKIKGESDLYFFATIVCEFGRNPDPNGPRITEDQKELLQWLQSSDDKWMRMVLTPRDTLKSTCLQAYILWRIVKDPNIRILLYGEVHDQAKKRLSVMKRTMEKCETFKFVYGEIKGTPWNDELITVSTRTNMAIREATIETAGLDVVVNARHFDLIIPDDLHSNQNTRTKDQIEAVKEKVQLLLPIASKGSNTIFVGTFWNDNDVYNWMRETQKECEVFLRTSVNDEWTEFYYPHALPREELQKRKDMMRADLFSCQYLLDPAPSGNAAFQREQFTVVPASSMMNIRKFLLIDPAGDPTSEKASKRDSDYYGMVVAGVTPAQDIIFLDFYRGRVSPIEAIEQALVLMLRHKPYIISVERAGQANMAFYLKEEIRKRGIFAVIEEFMPKGRSKHQRIMDLEPLARRRKLYIAQEAQMQEEFLDEIIRITPQGIVAKHDDLSDAAAQIIDVLTKYGSPSRDDFADDMKYEGLMHLNPSSREYWASLNNKAKGKGGWVSEFLH